MVEFKLPDVGEGMHEGEITKLLVNVGDRVGKDQPIIEVQTDKVNAELPSPVEGVIEKIFYAEGETAKVGSTLFLIADGNPVAPANEPVLAPAPQQVKSTARQGTPGIGRVIATPYVRQLARTMNIDIEQVKGSGPAGRVTDEDLQRFNQPVSQESQPAAALAPAGKRTEEWEERIAMKGMRKKIAEHMVKSVTIIPHVTSVDELEMDALQALRERLKPAAEERQIKLTFLPFFIKAIVTALKEFKTLNASIDDNTGEIILKHYYHIGIATDTKDGLIVPVIKNADRKSIFQLAEEISQLAASAREGKLTIDQITGGTFTISNVGPIGGLQANPIINHPEVAIIALHKMEPRMVVRDMEGVIRLMMNFSLSFDHRIIDGVTAVRFTNRMKQLLENPDLLLAEMV